MAGVSALFETHLTVRDLAASVDFYRGVVGLEFAATFASPPSAFCWVGGPGQGMLGLWQGSGPVGLRLHCAFTLPLADVLAAPDRLRSLGVTPLDFHGAPAGEPSVIAWMPAASVFFHDPDGHSLEYLAMLPGPGRPDLGVLPWSAWQAAQG
ncbi:MAG TPA: VOC family protein [Thermomicrobiaceae bacterium]|nr:VOC family protein [Thermomicrobiaceae bacterium]